eukprot:15474012-Alexandrium_andersonii.AAC.1
MIIWQQILSLPPLEPPLQAASTAASRLSGRAIAPLDPPDWRLRRKRPHRGGLNLWQIADFSQGSMGSNEWVAAFPAVSCAFPRA